MIYILLIYFYIFAALFNFLPLTNQQYSFLAQSFLQGRLDFGHCPQTCLDVAFFNGKYFWPLGSLPAVILTPFVFVWQKFGQFFYQGYLNFFLVVLTGWLVFNLARRLGWDSSSAAYWVFAFVAGSSFLGPSFLPWSWNLAHTLATVLIFLLLLESLGPPRPFRRGLLSGLILLTRPIAGVGSLFFCLLTWFQFPSRSIRFLILVSIPFLIALVSFGFYNHERFGRFLESGYAYQIGQPESHLIAKSYGHFSLVHLPTNLYYFLIAGPTPVTQKNSFTLIFPYLYANPNGMGTLWISPYLLLVPLYFRRDKINLILLLTSAFTALPILLYWANGLDQFGYRYGLDFFPYLFLILLRATPKKLGQLSRPLKIFIILNGFWDLYLWATFFFWSPSN